jgi:hypothetical protein
MKRYITIALCALTVFGLGSCNKVHEEDFDNAGRSVTFQAQLGNDTRTGLALKFVPDWRQTTLSDVHIWEVAGSERYEGEDVKMRIPGEAEGNYEIALFKADFSNMTIIVNPPSNAPATRAGETYEYTAIVAPKDASGKFTVPSTQKPDTETLIDPHADFIVGKSPAAFDQSQAGKEVNLIFTRPVAISRLSIMNVSDPTIRQVRIYSSDKLTGSASYENVNFENATVSFDNSGSNVITLDYGSGVAMPAEGIFNAYFISLVGTKRITKIEVVTNAQTLTKEFEGGKALTFKVPDFKSIAVNMGDSVTPGPGEDQPQNIRFVRGTTNITDTHETFDLYTGGTYVSPTITGQAQGATLTYSSSDPAVATVSSTGVVTPRGVGETTISVNASKVDGYLAGYAEYTLTVTDSTPDAVDQPLKFMKNNQEITSDSYDFYNGGTYVSPTLDGAVQGATVTWAITCVPEGCATIDASGKVTPVTVGAAVITATASAVAPLYKQTSKSYDLEIKDTTPVVGPTVTINLEEATELVAGEKYVLVSNGFALVRDGDDASAAAFDATAMTVAVPTDLQETLEWTLEKKSGSITRGNEYVFTQGAYFFGIAMNTNQQTYTYTVEVNNGRDVSSGVSIQDHNLSLANDLMYYAGNSSNYYVFYNTADNIWDNEKVANTASPAATSKTALYKLKDMRAEQNPTFTAATAEYDLNGPRWTVAVPTLQNAKGTVTYESNNTTVAQVNASTGAVTIMNTARKGDTAVITAKAAGNDEYKPGSASYTISIINSAPVTTTAYYKVDQIVAGQQYIVVSGGNALTVNGTTLGAVAVVDNNGVIETSEDVAVWTAAEHIEYYSGTSAAGHFTLKSGDNYLQRKSNQSNQTAAVGDVPSTGKYYVWEYDGTHLYHLSSASTTFYMGYADNVWKFNYQTPYYEASLYSTTEPEAPVVVEQDLAFDPTEVVGSVGGVVTSPTLTGAKTPVTYSSSDPSVVTVNAETGALTLRAVGEADITATAAAGTVGGINYGEGSASYHVTVVPPLEPVAETTYTLVTNTLSEGTYILVSDDSSSSYNNRYTVALFPTVVTTSWSGSSPVDNGQRFNEKDVTLSGNSITTNDPEIVGAEIELVASGSGWKIKAKATGEYLVAPTENYRIPLSTNADNAAVFTISTAQNRSITTGNYYFFHSGSATGFTIRNTGSTVSNVRFYKKAKKAQTLSFSGASATYDLKDGGSWTNAVPALDVTGAETTVTYASSNTAVAVVNSTSGAITIPSTAKKGDTATITATAEETDEYEEATASYTITIVDTTPGTTVTYAKVTSNTGLVDGKQYLIVYENGSSSKVFKPILSGSTYTASAENAINAVVSGSTIESDDLGDCLVTLEATGSNFFMKAAGSYLYPSQSNLGAESSPTSSRALSITISSGKVTIKRSEYSHYLGFDSYFRRMGNDTGNLALYTVSDGTTPVTPDPPTPSTSTYSLITPSEFVSGGTYLIVSADSGNYNNSDKTKAFAGDTDGNVVTVDGTSGTITGDFSACEFVITESGGNYTLKIGSNYVTGNQNSGSRYIQVSTTAGTMSLATAAEAPDPGKTGEGLVADAFYFYYTKTSGGTTSKEVLYLNSDGKYKIGGSGRKYGAYLFKKN